MPKKKASKAKSASKEKKKAPARPTRCGPDFRWQPMSPLITATVQNDTDRVARLLNRGADPNTALHRAIGRGKFTVASLLLDAGATVHTDIQPGDYYVPPLELPKPQKSASKSAKGKKGKGKGKKKKK
eukprot:m.51508 g.51508  ORF g.51508 m.51508 type:complete len:128 (-) comp11239_c4_seq1:326-709(-)